MIRKRPWRTWPAGSATCPATYPPGPWRPRSAPPARWLRRAHSFEAHKSCSGCCASPISLRSGATLTWLSDGPGGPGVARRPRLRARRRSGLTLGKVIAHFDGSEHAPTLGRGHRGRQHPGRGPEGSWTLRRNPRRLADKLGLQHLRSRRKSELEPGAWTAGSPEAERAELPEFEGPPGGGQGVNSALEMRQREKK